MSVICCCVMTGECVSVGERKFGHHSVFGRGLRHFRQDGTQDGAPKDEGDRGGPKPATADDPFEPRSGMLFTFCHWWRLSSNHLHCKVTVVVGGL